MPTAYTAAVSDGTITELEPFVMQLARGMGALIMMRDEPWDAPVPEAFAPSTYNADRLAEQRNERDRLRSMTADEAQSAAQVEVQEYEDALAQAKAEHATRRQRYEEMIAKVEEWQGAPEGIKEFALQQLGESLTFDARDPFTFYRERPAEDGQEWRAAKLEEIDRSILYHAKTQAEEEARTEGRNAWLQQLRTSLSAANG